MAEKKAVKRPKMGPKQFDERGTPGVIHVIKRKGQPDTLARKGKIGDAHYSVKQNPGEPRAVNISKHKDGVTRTGYKKGEYKQATRSRTSYSKPEGNYHVSVAKGFKPDSPSTKLVMGGKSLGNTSKMKKVEDGKSYRSQKDSQGHMSPWTEKPKKKK